MNTQHTISPSIRSLLTLMGSAGIFALMFFGGAQPITNVLALVGIIPIILGLTGDNLFSSFFAKNVLLDTPAPTPSPRQNTQISSLSFPLSHDNDSPEQRAA